MNFIYDLLKQKFDFIIPLFYIIIGIVAAIVIFLVRFSIYTKRKRYYAKLQTPILISEKEYDEQDERYSKNMVINSEKEYKALIKK